MSTKTRLLWGIRKAYEASPFLFFLLVLVLSWDMLNSGLSASAEYIRFAGLMRDATTWEELQFYTQIATMYSAQADTYFVFSFTVMLTGFGLTIAMMNGMRSTHRLASIDDTLAEILELSKAADEAQQPTAGLAETKEPSETPP